MDLDHLLSRCRGYEERAAALYRRFAAHSGSNADARALWTALAGEEESHARMLVQAARWLDRPEGWRTHLDGWEEALQEVEERFEEAERPAILEDLDRMLAAALALERTELDTLSRRLLRVARVAVPALDAGPHTDRLLAAAARSSDPTVRFEAALLRGHVMLESASRAC